MNAWIAAAAARSFRAGVVTGLGAMTADAILGTVVYVLARVVDLHVALRGIYAVGAAVMAYLGTRLLRAPAGSPTAPAETVAFARALLLGISNPFQIVWWLTAGIAFAYLGGLVLLLGLFGAIAVWIVVFPWAVHVGARQRPNLERLVRVVSGAILIGFAAYFAALAVIA